MNIHGKGVFSFRMFRSFSQAPSVHLSCLLFALFTFLTAPAESALIKFKYDPAGNMVSEQGKYYEYNDANQLVRVRKDSPTGEIIAEYVYDYQGQRVKKTENGVTTYYIGKHYEERKGDTVDEKTSYFFANSQRIARSTQKNKGSPELSYYLNNHLGSADVIVNEQGTQTDRLRYLPFGGYRTFPQERHTFTGKERDEVTDNYYFEARYYNSNIRRFTQADTIIPDLYDPQSLNRYAYPLNNPVKYIDPSGHNPILAIGIGALVIGAVIYKMVNEIQDLVDRADATKEYAETHDDIESYENMREQFASTDSEGSPILQDVIDVAESTPGTSLKAGDMMFSSGVSASGNEVLEDVKAAKDMYDTYNNLKE
ncbi:MAG: RHS repeat-associated core domain-containing protein [Candidatus Electrothrix sp. AR5]|nr:RHS repeat-associated core domain-containing protein [Candidatus Electrothrix sp. AR5]